MVGFHDGFGIREWASLIVGLIVASFGIVPLLKTLGILSLPDPMSILGNYIVWIIITIAAIIEMLDIPHMLYTNRQWMMISIPFMLVTFALGVIPLLHHHGIIGFNITFISGMFLHVLLAVTGLLLMVLAWKSE